MPAIHAYAVSGQLLGLPGLGAGTGAFRVHSVFPHGVNLAVSGRLVFVGDRRGDTPPYGVCVPEGQLSLLEVAPGDEIHWTRADMRFTGSRFALCLAGAAQVDNRLSRAGDAGQSGQFGPTGRPEKGSEAWREALCAMTGFGIPVGEAADPARAGNPELRGCLMNRDSAHVQGVLKRWVGAGPGLTPSGDDFLAGLLLADHVCPAPLIVGSVFKEVLQGLLREGYTTDVGRHYLECALEGLASESWIQLVVHGCLAGDVPAQRDGLSQVLSLGHTSGADTLAGFLYGIQIWTR
ncbi:MAG: DUF2877 domain-containing protein [Clostridiales Family XIII bacterium]|nr:DUF2877 domain-containing protein [Clostridiales Family XIII bacterium]